jgi:hypothetical protein
MAMDGGCMSIKNCSLCGQVFLSSYEKVCKSCIQLHLKETRKVKDFMKVNPRASLIEVYQQTGVPLRTIKELCV